MNVSAIGKHKQGVLYLVQKSNNTAAVPYVGPNMEAVLRAYREMWKEDPYSVIRGHDFPAMIISGN